jgi:hypothetical protein
MTVRSGGLQDGPMMDTPTPVLPVARRPARGRRRLALGLTLAVSAVSLGLAAPTAFGQATPRLPAAQADQSTASDRAAGACAGRDGPKSTAPFLRTELYFGSNKPDGSVVTEEQFQQFLDREITTRFPDGLTLLTGLGQFRGSNGVLQRERSMVLILLYPAQAARSSEQKIEEIRDAYKRQYRQESVLRADEPRPECVSF